MPNTPDREDATPPRPLRRDPALVPLSHDHHQGLVAAQRLKRGEPAYRDCDDPIQSILLLWERELEFHFRQEEEHLFDPGGKGGELVGMIGRALDEHAEFRRMVAACADGDRGDGLVREFGLLLERHIRFEERELFPALQEHLDRELLAELGAIIAEERRLGGPGRGCAVTPRGS